MNRMAHRISAAQSLTKNGQPRPWDSELLGLRQSLPNEPRRVLHYRGLKKEVAGTKPRWPREKASVVGKNLLVLLGQLGRREPVSGTLKRITKSFEAHPIPALGIGMGQNARIRQALTPDPSRSLIATDHFGKRDWSVSDRKNAWNQLNTRALVKVPKGERILSSWLGS